MKSLTINISIELYYSGVWNYLKFAACTTSNCCRKFCKLYAPTEQSTEKVTMIGRTNITLSTHTRLPVNKRLFELRVNWMFLKKKKKCIRERCIQPYNVISVAETFDHYSIFYMAHVYSHNWHISIITLTIITLSFHTSNGMGRWWMCVLVFFLLSLAYAKFEWYEFMNRSFRMRRNVFSDRQQVFKYLTGTRHTRGRFKMWGEKKVWCVPTWTNDGWECIPGFIDKGLSPTPFPCDSMLHRRSNALSRNWDEAHIESLRFRKPSVCHPSSFNANGSKRKTLCISGNDDKIQ